VQKKAQNLSQTSQEIALKTTFNTKKSAQLESGFSKTFIGKAFSKKKSFEGISEQQKEKIVSVLTIKNFMASASKFKKDC